MRRATPTRPLRARPSWSTAPRRPRRSRAPPRARRTPPTSSLGLESNDPKATFRCSLNGGTAEACTSPYVLSGKPEGSYEPRGLRGRRGGQRHRVAREGDGRHRPHGSGHQVRRRARGRHEREPGALHVRGRRRRRGCLRVQARRRCARHLRVAPVAAGPRGGSAHADGPGGRRASATRARRSAGRSGSTGPPRRSRSTPRPTTPRRPSPPRRSPARPAAPRVTRPSSPGGSGPETIWPRSRSSTARQRSRRTAPGRRPWRPCRSARTP